MYAAMTKLASCYVKPTFWRAGRVQGWPFRKTQ